MDLLCNTGIDFSLLSSVFGLINKFRMLIRWLSHSNSISSSSSNHFDASIRFEFKFSRLICQKVTFRRGFFSIIDGGCTFLSYLVFCSYGDNVLSRRFSEETV